jgi:hypothetical protein
MSKNIPTTSLAKRSTEKRDLRRRILAHGSTDSDDIEAKRQHCTKQLMKMSDNVRDMAKMKVLMEDNGEKAIQAVREQFAAKRPQFEADPTRLAAFDNHVKSQIDAAAYGLMLQLTEHEYKIVTLMGQIQVIESNNLIIDCLTLRESVEGEDGKKSLTRETITMNANDTVVELQGIREAFEEILSELRRLGEAGEPDETPVKKQVVGILNGSQPIPGVNKK